MIKHQSKNSWNVGGPAKASASATDLLHFMILQSLSSVFKNKLTFQDDLCLERIAECMKTLGKAKKNFT